MKKHCDRSHQIACCNCDGSTVAVFDPPSVKHPGGKDPPLGDLAPWSPNCYKSILKLIMQVTHHDDIHFLALDDREASSLLDALALVAMTAESVPGVVLPDHMRITMFNLFVNLHSQTKATQSSAR